MVEITNGNGKTYARIGMKTLATIFVAAISYVGAGVWWAATTSARLDSMHAAIEAIDTGDRYRGGDADRDWSYHMKKYHEEP